MRKIHYFLLILFLIAACSKKEKMTISVSDQVVNTMQGGIGVNFTNFHDSLPVMQLKLQYRSFGGSTWGANPELSDTAAWNKVFVYADWMGLDMCRLLISRKNFEPEKGKVDYNTTEMQYLFKYLDYCELNHIDVFLQNMWNNVAWLAVPTAGNDPVRILRSAPNDLEVYTDGLINLLKYLIVEKKYTCIKYLSLSNEPFENWSWYIESFGPDKFASPEPAYQLMHEKIARENLPVKLSGPDVSMYLSSELHPDKQTVFNHFDAYDIHSYLTRFDWWKDSMMTFEDGFRGEINKISDTEKQYAGWIANANKTNKPFIFSEMGTFMNGFGEDTVGVSSYISLLKDVESVIRYSNIGADGFMRWSFLNRGNLDGQWANVRTYDMKHNRLLPSDSIQPQSIPFYMWGLLSRFTPKYAQILASGVDGYQAGETQHVFVCTYKDPNTDDLSIYMVNDGEVPVTASLEINTNQLALKKYTIEEKLFAGKQFGEVDLIPTEFESNKKLVLPARSLVLLTSYIAPPKNF